MSNMGIRDARRPAADALLQDIADYVLGGAAASEEARSTAFYCLLDTLACGMLALKFPACTRLLGPVVPGAEMPDGARVPGTNYRLEPVQAAFNIGAMVRWLDFNDTWLAAEWGHPSDNLGGILAVADYLSRNNAASGRQPLTVADLLDAMIRAHEIQGVLALKNSFNGVGPGPRPAGAHRQHRGGGGDAGRQPRTGHQRRVQCLDRRRRIAHIPPRPQYRIEEKLGGGRCNQSRRAPCPDRADRRDGLPVRAERGPLGLPGRAVQAATKSSPNAPSAVTLWKTSCSRFRFPPSSMPRPRWKRRWRCMHR